MSGIFITPDLVIVLTAYKLARHLDDFGQFLADPSAHQTHSKLLSIYHLLKPLRDEKSLKRTRKMLHAITRQDGKLSRIPNAGWL